MLLAYVMMILGVMIVLLIGADAMRRQIMGSAPALTQGGFKWAVAGVFLLAVGFFLLPTIAFVEYLF